MNKINLIKKITRVCILTSAVFIAILLGCIPCVRAEGESSSPSPSPTPTPISVPSGYSRFSVFGDIGFGDIYTPDSIEPVPEGFIDPTSWNDGSYGLNMFDGDLSNGELLVNDSVLDSKFYGYKWEDDHWNDMYEYSFSDFCSRYYIGYNTQGGFFNCCFLGGMNVFEFDVCPIGVYADFSQPYGVNENVLYFNVSTVFQPLQGYNNVFAIESIDNWYWHLNGSNYGSFVADPNNPHWSDQLFSTCVCDVPSIFATNYPNIYTINPSERGGGDELTKFSDASETHIESEFFGSPHVQIVHKQEETIYPDGSGGDDSNNMYMETADWKFNIPKYWGDLTVLNADPTYINNWGKGHIYFDGQINDYQIENASHFNLSFSFYIKFNGEYALGGIEDNGPVFRKFAKSCKITEHLVPLSAFIENNNRIGFDVIDIFDNAIDSDGYSFTTFMRDMSIYSKYRNIDWTISCSAKLVSGNYVSGNIQETYNFMTQISKEDSNTITDNTNPYYPPDENGDPDIPTNDNNSNTDYSKNGINIHINNNPTFSSGG